MPRRLKLLAVAACLVIVAAVPTAAVGEEGGAWVRVQLDHRITQADFSGITEAGLTNLQYSPTNAYLAYGDGDAAEEAAELAGVSSVRTLGSAEKTSSGLAGRTGVIPVAITHASGATALTRLLLATGARFGSYSIGGTSSLAVTEALVDSRLVSRIAALPAVLHVGVTGLEWELEDEGATQILASNITAGKPVPGYETFLSGLGIDGSGVTVGIVDDGVDATHPDFTGRLTKITTHALTNAPPQGHGTHVAGIVGGAGATVGPVGRIKDSAGLMYGIGVAPKASLIDMPAIQLQNTEAGDFPPQSFELYSGPLSRAGAIAWNASWTDGGGAGAGYVARAANLDALTRDADTTTAGQQDFTFVFSAGNSGSGQKTVTSPKEAKNIITVGSSKGHRAGNVDDISSFSSRGPAADGRIEPTIVAPGETIMSARAATGVLCTAPLSGSTADAPPADGFTLYTGCSGTSMASPQVAGSVALIHDWWKDHNGGTDPSPAMDKALLINSAKDLKTRDIPNRNEGWGRVNLKDLFDPGTSRIYTDQSVVLSELDSSHDLRITTADPAKPLRVTVVWSDAPGEPGADPALVNDLDLTVTAASGATYLGNFFSLGRSVAGGEADRLNNMENVYLDAPSGSYDVSISAFGLPGDGVPGFGDETDQDFALVISNAVLA